jgi:hypothetical protein
VKFKPAPSSPKIQLSASRWAKREEERRRRRDRETRRRGEREIGRLGDGEMIGRLEDLRIGGFGDLAMFEGMFEGIFDCRFSIFDGRFIWNFMVLIILK